MEKMFLHIFRFWLGKSHLGGGKNSSKPIISYILVEWTSIKAPASFMWTELDTRVLISQINGISGVRAVFQGMCCRDTCGDGGFRRNSWLVWWEPCLWWKPLRICPEIRLWLSKRMLDLLESVRICEVQPLIFTSLPKDPGFWEMVVSWSWKKMSRLVPVQDCFMWIFSFCYTIFCCVYVALFIANPNGKDHWRLGRSMGDSGFRIDLWICGSAILVLEIHFIYMILHN